MNWNLRVLGLGSGARAFGLSLFGPFVYLYLRNVLGVSYPAIGLFSAVVTVPVLVALTSGGLLTDRLGRRSVYVLSLVGEGAALLATAFAMQRGTLPGVLSLVALGSTLSSVGAPALSAYVADFATGSERTEAFSWTRVGWNAGFSAGVAVAGVLIPLIGFVGAAALSGSVVLGAALTLAVSIDPSPYDRALPTASHRGSGFGPRTSLGLPQKTTARESLRILVHDRPFLVTCLGFALINLVTYQWALALPLFSKNSLHVSYGLLGAGLAVNGLVVVFGQTAVTRRVLGRRHTSIAIAGVGVYAAAFLALATIPAGSPFLAGWFLLDIAFLTIGENLLAVPFATMPSNFAPGAEIGAYNGGFLAVTSVGAAAAGIFGGFALGTLSNAGLLWSVLVIPAVPATLLLRHAASRIPREVDRA